MNEIINLKHKSKNILQKRSQVSRLLMQSSPNINCGEIDAISTGNLQLLFQVSPLFFLDHIFKLVYSKCNSKLKLGILCKGVSSKGASLMSVHDEAVQSIRNQIVNKFNPVDVILFGSRAKGLVRKSSDIDICVIKDTQNKRKLVQIYY